MNLGQDLPAKSAIWAGLTDLFVRIFIILFLNLVTGSVCLRLTSFDAPGVVDPRDGLQLDCHFDMGNEELYAVKWYKDDEEFFRYMPNQKPHTITFTVDGVSVVLHEIDCDKTRCKLRLQKLSTRYSSGAYRCEISSEAPAFRLAAETRNVTVAALPREKPKIEGLAPSYVEGEILTAECTSDFAYPAPLLRWFVNGEPVVPLARPTITKREVDELMAQTILLRLVISGNLSRTNGINIGCEATVPSVTFAPQLTTLTIPLKTSNGDGLANNEKLQLWYSAFSNTSSLEHSSYHVIMSILLYTLSRRVSNY